MSGQPNFAINRLSTTTAKKTARIDIRFAASSSSLGGSTVRPGGLPAVAGVAPTGARLVISP